MSREGFPPGAELALTDGNNIHKHRSMEEQKDKTASGFEMHKVLGPFSLVMLGIGCIVGAGVFVLTGVAARKYAG